MTGPVSWWRSDRDGRVHAWTGQQWGGWEIAACQHSCPPLHVICDRLAPVCRVCAAAVDAEPVRAAS